jgi:hypothetical protein
MNIYNSETATSVARRGGSGSFAAGGGDVSPTNCRLGQRPAGPEIATVVMTHGAKDRGMTARGWRTGSSGLEAAGRTSSGVYLRPQMKK